MENDKIKKKSSLAEAQRRVDTWIKEHGRGYFDPLTNTCLLTEEMGELARIMAIRYGMQRPKVGEKAKDLREATEEELGDLLWLLCCLANQMDIGLEQAFEKSMDKKNTRDIKRYH